MNPITSLPVAPQAEPNVELLRRGGWSPASVTGAYCVAWRGRDEVVFEWRDGDWYRVGGRGSGAV